MHLVQMALEAIEGLAPEGAIRGQPVVNLAQRLRPQAVDTALRIDAHLDQARISQHAEVLGDRWLAQGQPVDELADGPLAWAQEVEDSAPVSLGEHLERGRHTAEYALSAICLSRHPRWGAHKEERVPP